MALKLSPSLVTAWLSCPHYLNLRLQGEPYPARNSVAKTGAEDDHVDSDDDKPLSMAALLKQRGTEHELNALSALKEAGLDVFECDVNRTNIEDKARDYLLEKALDHEIVYQMPFSLDGMRGIADFIVRDGDKHLPADAKLARKAAKPGHVLQLCFYADAIEAATGKRPTHIEIWLGGLDGQGLHKKERHQLQDVDAYWRRMKTEIKKAIERPLETKPEPCDHCAFCEYSSKCEVEWRGADAVHFVSGVSKRDRAKLTQVGIETRGALANASGPVPELDERRLELMRRQAKLQVEACPDPRAVPDFEPHAGMPIYLLPPNPEDPQLRGLHALPKPDDGDLFLDYEGHPFWTVEEGLIFLFGLHYRESGRWTYEAWWAHSKDDEQRQSNALVSWIARRRLEFPDMHVYHYNHTERSTLSSLIGESEDEPAIKRAFEALQSEGVFVDLLQTVRQSLQVGVESYGLKNIEKVAGYRRPEDTSVGRGADAVGSYERWMRGSGLPGRDSLLEGIQAYNEQDVIATRAVRDWLVSLRETLGVEAWPIFTASEESQSQSETELQLLEFPQGSPQRLLGHVLGYWRRESAAAYVALKTKLEADRDRLLHDEEVVGAVRILGRSVHIDEKGKESLRLQVEWPPQRISKHFKPGATLRLLTGDGMLLYSQLISLSENQAVISDVRWEDKETGSQIIPTDSGIVSFCTQQKIDNSSKEAQLALLGEGWLAHGGSFNALSSAILTAATPNVLGDGVTPDVESISSLIGGLDGDVLAIQGPPGTGKTYTAANIIKKLLAEQSGVSIGVAAVSHSAVDNLLEALKEEVAPEDLKRIGRVGSQEPLPDFLKFGRAAPRQELREVVFGTVSVFCNKTTADRQFDVLFIDEAGQMSLADALALSMRANSIILLGDPLQLPQVAQASHPEGSGRSVLEHFLDGEETISPERGVLLETSRRMHPSICGFISGWRYGGRLMAFADCANLSTAVDSLADRGVGLRIKLMNHAGNDKRSLEEVDEVVRIANMALGRTWTDKDGKKHEIGVQDILVVSPFNLQRVAIDDALKSNTRTTGIQVGTVDKFQGKEAPIVIFSMAASSSEDLERGADFLFDSNRLNVAISRAKCLAYVICNEPLLSSRARSVEQMKLISGLCSFVEQAVSID